MLLVKVLHALEVEALVSNLFLLHFLGEIHISDDGVGVLPDEPSVFVLPNKFLNFVVNMFGVV